MDFELSTLDLAGACAREAGALIVVVCAEARWGQGPVPDLIRRALDGDFLGAKAGDLLRTFGAQGVATPQLVLAQAAEGDARSLRKAVAAAVSALKGGPAADAVIYLPTATETQLQAAVLAAADAGYQYRWPGQDDTKKVKGPGQVQLGTAQAENLRPAFERAVAIAAGIRLAREWANRPGNQATPTALAAAAEAMAAEQGLHCKVLGPEETDALGMGALRAVAQGSAQPSRFIELRYEGAGAEVPPVVLVGKGITFDAGGISIKPAAAMDEMKFDMGGAAGVLGTFRALGQLRPAINVVGLIAAAENLPGGKAVKPGDVITGMSGQTIEVLNTDAEGRLVLSDALTYAQRFQPRTIIDLATLTGACVVALGAVRSGLFSNSDALAQALLAAGDEMQDPCWRMPLDDEYAESLKSNFADVANMGGRPAGAVTAAKFLQRFIPDCDWAHLDIAGTAWKQGKAKGATGRPVALLVHYLLSQAVG